MCMSLAAGTIWLIGCGGESAGAPVDALDGLDQWCAAIEDTSLPALSSPNPDGHEVEAIEEHIAHWDLLSRDTPGVPETATAAAAASREALVRLRDAVQSGEPLSSLLAEQYTNWVDGNESLTAPGADLFVTATKSGTEASAICP
jgi:hypothetical protein